MRIRVDDSRCQGHTQCNFIAPMLFRLRDEDGHSEAAVDVVPPDLEDVARLACNSCPEGAIVVEDD